LTERVRVLVYTENYEVGGCDRYIADLAAAVDGDEVQLEFAGNRNPVFDEYLARRAPAVLPRATLPIANMREPLVARAWRRVRPAPAAETDVGDDAPPGLQAGSPARDALVAALRYRQNAANFIRLRRLIRRLRPDVVHVNNGGYPGGESCRMVVLAARAEGVPGVVHFVHNMAYPPEPPERVERALDARIDRATSLWATAADRASDALHVVRGIPREHVETVHYGLRQAAVNGDVPSLLQGETRPVLTVVASFEPRKGHYVLLEALSARRAQGAPAVRTLLLGEGALRPRIEQEAAARGLSEDVEFLGWREDVAAILHHSTLLVLPSTGHECLPYAILEAMAAGLPVVSTDVAGIPEMVDDGRTGRVVAPGDANALALAVDDVLAQPGRGEAMGEAGRRRIDWEFSLDRLVEATTGLWRRALAARPR
jgi:glycosyltransferase involved in cell wall biosynthesis